MEINNLPPARRRSRDPSNVNKDYKSWVLLATWPKSVNTKCVQKRTVLVGTEIVNVYFITQGEGLCQRTVVCRSRKQRAIKLRPVLLEFVRRSAQLRQYAQGC